MNDYKKREMYNAKCGGIFEGIKENVILEVKAITVRYDNCSMDAASTI
jgi:hypothetical protein